MGTAQVSPSQVDSAQIWTVHTNTSKIPLPSSISFEQFLSIHNSTPASIYTINNSAQTLWSSLLSPTTPLNINLLLTDLPTGQLAEAQITSFDPSGRPNGGTLLIDHNANGIGWYIDPTPFDNSEFTQTLTDTAFRATTDSPAYGRYDLLTTLLHEIGHLAGFIDGYKSYDSHIQTLNGSPLFVGDNFSATLTPDLSHLDPKHYPYDLMNPTLTPGVRKLPSLLDLQILNTTRQRIEESSSENVQLNAPLDSDPLIAILNGNFDSSNTTEPDYGWSTRGATAILNGQAILSEDKHLLSNFTQTFIVPQAAKYLQFTLLDTTLGTSPLDPPDAFEVALLDANTLTSLVSTATGLTSTDSLLNIQHDGKAYFSPQVTVPLTATPSHILSLHSPTIYKVDISNIAPGTLATLYFDLLGFGEQDSQVILDNILLLNQEQFAPIANNDSATTDQAKPVAIALLLY
ncbi:hypothetical protein NDA00_17430 [Funiculus sociatus GB2-M2]|uniref:hypothetical protein n=1 Tax=Cyanophyceae TaxID=3028117 RepID=UPI001F54F1C6|nr:hypothetical protein [Trichocoleus sp. FACHB-90]